MEKTNERGCDSILYSIHIRFMLDDAGRPVAATSDDHLQNCKQFAVALIGMRDRLWFNNIHKLTTPKKGEMIYWNVQQESAWVMSVSGIDARIEFSPNITLGFNDEHALLVSTDKNELRRIQYFLGTQNLGPNAKVALRKVQNDTLHVLYIAINSNDNLHPVPSFGFLLCRIRSRNQPLP